MTTQKSEAPVLPTSRQDSSRKLGSEEGLAVPLIPIFLCGMSMCRSHNASANDFRAISERSLLLFASITSSPSRHYRRILHTWHNAWTCRFDP